MSTDWPLPTVLVTGNALRHRDAIIAELHREGYLVLECPNQSDALEIARLHSRPIHIMLMDDDGHHRDLASKLHPYRPHTHVLFINWGATENADDAVAPHLALRRIHEILKPAGEQLTRNAG